jgi:hypothetical protein
MANQIQINFTVASFPVGWSGDLNAYAQELVSLLTAKIQGNIMPGIYSQGTITLPTSDQGPIFMNGQWYYWNTTSLSYQLYTPQTAAVGPSRSPNILDNADFKVNQRQGGAVGSSVTVTSTLSYPGPDRWFSVQSSSLTGTAGVAVQTATNLLGAADRFNSKYFLRVQVLTSQLTLGAGDFLYIGQRLELKKARILFDLTPSLYLYLRSSVTGTFCVFIGDAGSGSINGQDAQIVFPCSITTANVWTKFPFPAFVTPPYGSGTWGTNDTDFSMQLVVVLAAGTNFQQNPALDQLWQTNSRTCDSNQINILGAGGGGALDIAIAQLEPGPTCSQFDWRSFDQEVYNCQEFYDKSYDYVNAPGATSDNSYMSAVVSAANASTGFNFHRKMRVPPGTVTIYSQTTGSAGFVREIGTTSGDKAIGTLAIGSGGVGTLGNVGSTAGDILRWHYAASADL